MGGSERYRLVTKLPGSRDRPAWRVVREPPSAGSDGRVRGREGCWWWSRVTQNCADRRCPDPLNRGT